MKYDLRPLGVGQILDQTIKIVKDHFGLFITIMLCLQIPLTLVFQLLMTAVAPQITSEPLTPEQAAAMLRTQIPLMIGVAFPFALLTGLVVVPITNAAIMHATACVYLDRKTTVGEALRVGLRRFLPLMWTWLLVYLFVLGGLLLCILPGVLLAFRYALAANVAVLEHRSGMEALNRSRDLMLADRTRNYNTVFLLGLVVVAISFGLNSAAGFISQPYVAAVVAVLLQAVQQMFWLVALVVFYFSCRSRAEDFDLMQLANAVGRIGEMTPEERPSRSPG
jgi:hypothetical protein